MNGICEASASFYAPHIMAAALTGPQLLLVLGLTVGFGILLKFRYTATERLLPEEVGQTPLYTERCGTGGKGGTTFQRVALYDQGMVLAQDRSPVFLRYLDLQEAWRSGLGPWSRVQVRVSEEAWRSYYPPLARMQMIFPDRVLAFASRDPDRILQILQGKGVRPPATAST
jgi:hypothetical protein